MHMERFTHNLVHNKQQKLRYEQLEGRSHVVVPVVLMVEGVHHGTKGPVLYNLSSFSELPELWNSKPIVLNHPEGDTANTANYLSEAKLGVVLNAAIKDKRLVAEAWLDVERLAALAPQVLQSIRNGKAVEVSTGLLTEIEQIEGTWNHESYIAVVKKMYPDHLAVLPDQKGACSLNDGCGLLKNELEENVFWAVLNATPKEELTRLAAQNQKGFSLNDKYDVLTKALRTSRGDMVWLIDLFDDVVVFQDGSQMYKQAYSIDSAGGITLSGKAVLVHRVVKYEVANKENDMPAAEVKEEKASVGKEGPAATKNCGTESAKTEAPKTEPAQNKTAESGSSAKDPVGRTAQAQSEPVKVPQTAEEYIANAPCGIREVLQHGVTAYERERAMLVDSLIGVKNCDFTKEQLSSKPVVELQKLAKLASVGPYEPRRQSTVANYGAMADAAVISGVEEPLPIPVYNFGTEK